MAALDMGLDTADAAETMTSFLAETLDETGADGYVLGVSGGLDSAVVAKLAAEAVGSDAVTELVMPGEPSDTEIAAETDIDRTTVERFVQMVEATEHKRSRPPSPSIDR